MKKILLLFILFNTLLVTLLGGLVFLAETHPLRPGDRWYGLQQQAEQWRLALTAGPSRQTDVALHLVEHRLADLAEADEACYIDIAITAFDQALNETVRRIEPASVAGRDRYYSRLQSLLIQSEVILAGLAETSPAGPTADMATLLARKISNLQLAASQPEMMAVVPVEITFVEAAAIPFLAAEVDHSLYPLTGAHAELECVDCHPAGTYADTPKECQACHAASLDNLYGLVLYPNHFEGACSDCHLDENWTPYQFDHRGVIDCQSCHTDDSPADHYPGPCLLCHTDVVNWEQATYLHAEVTECRGCHLADTPPYHYLRPEPLAAGAGVLSNILPQQTPSACSNCHHNTADWIVVTFDHTGFEDCLACHQQEDRPAEHYQGQCSNCHTTAGWEQSWFNHTGFDICQKCHAPEVEDHYLEECSTCHIPTNWQLVTFDHTSFDTCAACHLAQAPAGHYPDQCATCHNSHSWREITVDHTGFDECEGCHNRENHYPGLCSHCHNTTNWLEYSFDHTGFSDCKACHSRPGHEWGQCSKCHTVERWDDVDFDHGDLTDCIECHDGDALPDHFSGQCSDCHNTSRWDDPEVNHDIDDDCQACHTAPDDHWSDQCSTCHNTTDWNDVEVDHSGFDDCQSCHAASAGHWPGQCSTCHNTTDWNDVEVDHSDLNDCLACHTAPSGHWSTAQCSNCHTTEDWNDVNFDHTGYTRCRTCHQDDVPEDHPQRQCAQCHTTDSWDVPE